MTVHDLDVSDQLVGCSHPDCLAIAEFLVTATWGNPADVSFDVAPTCLSHVAWSVQQLLMHLDEPGEPRLLVARLV